MTGGVEPVSNHRPMRPARAELGDALREIRQAAGRTTRQVSGYSSGHISTVERGGVVPSWALVQTYIDELGGDPNHLQQLYRRTQDEVAALRVRDLHARHPAPARTNTPPQHVAEAITIEQVRQHYQIEYRAEEYRLDADGVVTQMRCSNRIRAISPDVTLFVSRHTYDSDRRPEVLHVTADTGCRVEALRTRAPTGGMEAYLRLDSTLHPDAPPYDLAYRVHVASRRRAYPRLLYRAPDGLREFRLRATFTPPALPKEIWAFEAPATIDAEFPQDRLNLAEDGSCHRTFSAPAAGWYYGITWTW